ncbi:hypothetical protein [Microbacterium sp. P01]|uniref:hypothetical protein n=1 Tax=unclassified Microbacterium TaxID=2609290 RepID=UPI0036707078
MARIGGRNLWIAIPVGVLCTAVVGALVVLSAPMIPVAATWVGDSLRTASTYTEPSATPGSPQAFASATTSGCRSLYPDSLWSELTWTPDVLLEQTTGPPAGDAPLTAALAPDVRVTCVWNAPGGRSISTTVAAVAGGSADVAQAALTASGFTCDTHAGLLCIRASGDVVEEHLVRDDLWISSVESAWHPVGYTARVRDFIWG